MPDELLEPGNALAFDRQIQKIEKFTFNTDHILGWKEGILIFEGENFDDFLIKIKRWYGIEFEVKGTPPANWSFSGYYENVSLKNY